MTKNERKDVWNTGSSKNLHGSTTRPGMQTDGKNTVVAVGTNRTIINGSTVFGASQAKKKINGF